MSLIITNSFSDLGLSLVTITKSDINTGALAGLQGDLSKALTRADKLIKAGSRIAITISEKI